MRSPRRTLARRAWVTVAAVLGSAALVAGGWLLAGAFVSPEQQAAAAEPPAPQPVTAIVESGSLVETATAQGSVEAGRTQSLAVAGGDCSVVTAQTIDVGEVVGAGTVVTEACGRPVIALPGDFEFYRDLWPGAEGPDVTQLQEGLTRAGYPVGIDGVLGTETLRAVRALYRDRDYPVPMGFAPEQNAPSIPAVGEGEPPTQQEQTTYVPRSELTVFSGDGGTCARPLDVGTDLAAGASVDLVSDGLVVRVDASASGLLAVTAGVQAQATSGAVTVDLEVAEVVPEDASSGAAQVIQLVPTADPLPVEWSGIQVVVVFVLRDAGVQETIVPSTAVDFTSDGRAFVMRRDADGTFERVDVEEVASVAGRSAVQALDGELTVGDVVIVR